MPKGLDIGTCFLVGASHTDTTEMSDVGVKSVRDAFLAVDNENTTKNMLKMNKVGYIEKGDQIFIVGDPALHIANMFKENIRRPLSKGLISPGEREAEGILFTLIEEVVGKPSKKGEVCYFSIPANPIDVPGDNTYHSAIFKKILEEIGYTAFPMNEAAAIIYSNCMEEGFTGLASSCLTPGQKIFTSRGLVNIEEVLKEDKVLTKEGTWSVVIPTSREYKGDVYLLQAYGAGKVEVTSDHLIWINRENSWKYIKASEVREGDLVMQPWDNYNYSDRPYICTEERVTSSKEVKTSNYHLTDEMAELIGYFLGDGTLEKKRGAINWTLNKSQPEKIDHLIELIDSLFGKKATIYSHNEGADRVKMYSKGLLKWLDENCYSEDREKRVPWDISNLNNNVLRNILAGLIATDGYISEGAKPSIGFDNTSPYLAQFVYLSFQRLGYRPSISVSAPRKGKAPVSDGHVINGKKECFQVLLNGDGARQYTSWLYDRYKTSPKSYTWGSNVSRINKITKREFEGTVYDVSVQDGDNSFCVPGIAVHNCGAGMVNTSLMYKTILGMSFATSQSGDYIDESAARAVGATASKIMAIKEEGVDLMDPSKGNPKYNREREAIIVYYRNLIKNTVSNIKKEFRKSEGDIQITEPIPWILSGGTTQAKNFLKFFKQEFGKMEDFPIPLSEIRMAKDPYNDVAKGLLIAAANEES